jgi:glycerol uptake facilitator-like aquaporin
VYNNVLSIAFRILLTPFYKKEYVMAGLKKGALQCALVEAVGTFLLALTVFQTRDPLAIGLVLMAALYFGAHGHIPYLNSAVGFGEWFSGSIDLNDFLVTLGGQVVGAVGAAILSTRLSEAAPMLHGGMKTHMLGLTEVLTTFVFVSVVMAMLSQADRLKNTDLYGLVIGLTATGLIILGGGAALFNPAIALGVIIHCKMLGMAEAVQMPHVVAYVLVPFVGAILAVWYYDYVRGMKK